MAVFHEILLYRSHHSTKIKITKLSPDLPNTVLHYERKQKDITLSFGSKKPAPSFSLYCRFGLKSIFSRSERGRVSDWRFRDEETQVESECSAAKGRNMRQTLWWALDPFT